MLLIPNNNRRLPKLFYQYNNIDMWFEPELFHWTVVFTRRVRTTSERPNTKMTRILQCDIHNMIWWANNDMNFPIYHSKNHFLSYRSIYFAVVYSLIKIFSVYLPPRLMRYWSRNRHSMLEGKKNCVKNVHSDIGFKPKF